LRGRWWGEGGRLRRSLGVDDVDEHIRGDRSYRNHGDQAAEGLHEPGVGSAEELTHLFPFTSLIYASIIAAECAAVYP
jgi:hypothetical protein